MGKDERLVSEVIGCAGNLIHNVTGLVGFYRSHKPDGIEYTDRAAERVMRWIIHNRKRGNVITLRQMNAKEAQFMAEEQQEVH
jgi:hypothetical protein